MAYEWWILLRLEMYKPFSSSTECTFWKYIPFLEVEYRTCSFQHFIILQTVCIPYNIVIIQSEEDI